MDDVIYLILALACLPVGFLACVVGYRITCFTLFAIAALEGSQYMGELISILLYGYVMDCSEYWIVFFISGLVLACIAGFHFKSGICIAGFASGMELAALVMWVVSYDDATEMRLVWISVAGVIGAVLVFALKKLGLVVTTSFVGAKLFFHAIDYYFVWKSAAEDDDRVSEMLPWWSSAVVSLSLFAVGLIVQFAITARGVNHEARHQENGAWHHNNNNNAPHESKTMVAGSAFSHV